jgi:hypothetical protein
LMSSWRQRDIARADDERVMLARPCCTCHSPRPWSAPAARFRRDRPNCESTRGPVDAAGKLGGSRTGTPIADAP